MPATQGSFAGGELTPSLWGRRDLPRYAQSLRRCKNFMITPHGAAVSRPGTMLVAETKLSGGSGAKLIPFVYSGNNSLVLEFGNAYIRFHQNGAPVMNGGVPLEVATPYSWLDLPQLKYAQSGDVLTLVHQNYLPMELTRSSTLIWTLAAVAFMPIGPPAAPTFVANSAAGPLGAGAYSGATNYAAGAYVSSGGVVFMSLASGNLGNVLPGGGLSNAWWTPACDTTHPVKQWSWASTSIYRDANGIPHETLPSSLYQLLTDTLSLFIDRPATVATSAAPLPVGSTEIGRNVYRGRNQLFGLVGTVAVPAVGGAMAFNDDGTQPDYAQGPPLGTQPFQARPAPGQWIPASSYGGGQQVLWNGLAWTSQVGANAGHQPDVSGQWAQSTWNLAQTYSLGVWVNLGSMIYISLQGANTGNNPATSTAFWQAVFQYPATVCYFEQRRFFGGAGRQSNSVAGSASQQLSNFDRSGMNTNPANVMNLSKATDSVLFNVAATKREEIRSLVPIRSLLLMTSLAERSLRGAGGGALTNQSFDEKTQGGKGSSWLSPLLVGANLVLFNQVHGSRVRDLVYNYYADSYAGRDVSVHAEHLFRGHSLVDWAYASVPNAIAWCVRDDGLLLGLTYQDGPATDAEQDAKIDAWHQHETQGVFESVCSVTEGSEDAVYFIVGRTVQGGYRRFVERMATRVILNQRPLFTTQVALDQRTFIATDCSLLFDGRNTSPATMFFQGSDYSGGAQGTIVSAALSAADVGNQIVFDPDGIGFPIDEFDAVAPRNTPWSRTSTYAAGALVQCAAQVYFSLAANNVGNAPNSANASTWWAPANGPFPCTVLSFNVGTSTAIVELERTIYSPTVATPTTAWGRASGSFVVPHLAGQAVSAVADGEPLSLVADAAGNVILPVPACVVSIGLGYALELETLDLAVAGRDVRSNQKTVARIGLECEQTAPFSVQLGATFGDPPDFAAFDATRFVPFQQRKVNDPTGAPGALFTGYEQQNIKDTFQPYGRAAVYCTDPVPVSIMTITRDAVLGGSVS
jgi:hypothetical protein